MSWKRLEKHWTDTSVEYCDVCGNLLVRRYWEFSRPDGQLVRSCRQDDEDLARWLTDMRVRHPAPWTPADA